jgi:acyl carrier protein
LLSTVVALADGGVLLTGRLSPAQQPWLADETVAGAVFVELAVRAGDEVGCERIEELTLEAPLALPVHGGVQLQVTVGDSDEARRRSLGIHSRRDDQDGWTRHATGTLTTGTGPEFDLQAWPPPDAEAVNGYGAGWRRGDEFFIDVGLADDYQTDAARFGIHPALLDAVLDSARADDRQWPATWTGLSLRASGASTLRVRVAPVGDCGVSVWASDGFGVPVLSVDSVVLGSMPDGPVPAADDALFRMEWVPVVSGEGVVEVEGRVFRCEPASGNLAGAVRAAVLGALETLRSAGDERVAFVTQTGEVSHAAVRGLVRSAQLESPGRYTLIDVDGELNEGALGAAVASGEPELRVRGDELFAPRLARATHAKSPKLDLEGSTVLIVGKGTMARFVARRLVVGFGVRRLVLVSRSGGSVEGLEDLGVEVSVVACDAADREALAAVLAEVGPLAGVVHCAGVVEDGLVGSLSVDQVGRVLRSKVDVAVNLHELTAGMDLGFFLLFSSAVGVFGNLGQGAFAAANAFLDCLAEHRRRQGLPAVSLAWGEWERLADEAPALFDASLDSADALLVPVRINGATPRDAAEVHPLLRGMVRTHVRPVAGRGASVNGLAQRLAGRTDVEQEQIMLNLVCGHVAAVLGHRSPPEVQPDRAFKELGFDSLTAVELRNRLDASTGLRLPATLVFTHATPAALARHLRTLISPSSATLPVFGELQRLEDLLVTAPPDGDTRAKVAKRLEALLWKWRGDTDSATATIDRATLNSASAEDMFALIDRELGTP